MKRDVTIIYPMEFQHTYEVYSEGSNENLLEEIFANWNSGSGVECALFLRLKIRSMSVGDIVKIDSTMYLCQPMGWKVIDDNFMINLLIEMGNHSLFNISRYAALHDVVFMESEGKIDLNRPTLKQTPA